MSGTTSDEASTTRGRATRRRALAGAATVGLSLPLLAACADEGAPSAGTAPSPAAPETPPETVPETSDETETAGRGAGALAPVEDIPVGSGVVFTDSRVVVTRPVAGDVRCFSAVCPHEGCLVGRVTSTILCTCHNSSFDISTGEVLGGPSPAPLPPVDFTINNNQVVLS